MDKSKNGFSCGEKHGIREWIGDPEHNIQSRIPPWPLLIVTSSPHISEYILMPTGDAWGLHCPMCQRYQSFANSTVVIIHMISITFEVLSYQYGTSHREGFPSSWCDQPNSTTFYIENYSATILSITLIAAELDKSSGWFISLISYIILLHWAWLSL